MHRSEINIALQIQMVEKQDEYINKNCFGMTLFTNNYTSLYHITNISYCLLYGIFLDKYRIIVSLKVETDIIANISASPRG